MSIYMPEWNNENNKAVICHINQTIEGETLNPIVKCESETISKMYKVSFNSQLLLWCLASLYKK